MADICDEIDEMEVVSPGDIATPAGGRFPGRAVCGSGGRDARGGEPGRLEGSPERAERSAPGLPGR